MNPIETRKELPDQQKPSRRRGSRGKGRARASQWAAAQALNGSQPPNRVEKRANFVPKLITPSITEMNARIKHYKEAAEEWEKKFHEKTNATIEIYKQESEWHKTCADRLAEQVKELEKKLEAKCALERQGIIRTFEFIGIAALKEKIAEVFNTEAVTKTIEALVVAPQPPAPYDIKNEVMD